MLNNLLLLLTVLVPVVPLGKRLYFKSQVGRAVEQLQIEDYPTYAVFAVKNFSGGGEPGDLTDLPDETIINSINHDERGFEELEKTVNQHRSVEGDIRSFHLLWGEVEEISKVTGVSIPTVGIATTNGLLCAEYADGTYERIIFNPLDLETTASLTEIQTWARETATIESYHLTITFAFLWFIVAIINQGAAGSF